MAQLKDTRLDWWHKATTKYMGKIMMKFLLQFQGLNQSELSEQGGNENSPDGCNRCIFEC